MEKMLLVIMKGWGCVNVVDRKKLMWHIEQMEKQLKEMKKWIKRGGGK